MTDTEFWRELKPITNVFKADARPEVFLADAPTEDERSYVPAATSSTRRRARLTPWWRFNTMSR